MKPNEDGSDRLMMDCEQVDEHDVIDRYIAEKLPEKEAEVFERHYLGCKRCFAELQMRHAAAIELEHRPRPAVSGGRLSWKPAWQWSFVAAAIALAVVLFVLVRPSQQTLQPASTPQISARTDQNDAVLEKLASLDQVPPYVPGMIRGGETNKAIERFQAGMREYSSQNYPRAVAILSEAVRLDPQLKPAAFYLGVSYLVTSSPDDAILQLAKLTADPNYSEDAHWYLAKAYLKKRNAQPATLELQIVAELKGPHAAQAQQDLEQLKRLNPGR